MQSTIVSICFENSTKEYQYLLDNDTQNIKPDTQYRIPRGVSKYGTIFSIITIKNIKTVEVLPAIVTSGIKLNSSNHMANTYRLASERLKELRGTPIPTQMKVEKPTIKTMTAEDKKNLDIYSKNYCSYFHKVYGRMLWPVVLPYGPIHYKNRAKLVEVTQKLIDFYTEFGLKGATLGKYGWVTLQELQITRNLKTK